MPTDLKTKILKSSSGQRMVSYDTTGFYRNSYVSLWLFQAMGLQLDEIQKWITELPDQRFPNTVTWGVSWWEQAYGLPTDETLPLEERRARLKTLGHKGGPVNPARIERLIEDATGFKAHIDEHVAPYTFRLYLEQGEIPIKDMMGIFNLVRPRKPSHKTMQIQYTLNSPPGRVSLSARIAVGLRIGIVPFQGASGGITGLSRTIGFVKYGITAGVGPAKGGPLSGCNTQ